MLRPAASEAAFLGRLGLDADGDGLRVIAPVPPGTPAYAAGIASGDRLLAMNGRPLGSPGALAEALAAARPGDMATVTFEQRGAVKSARVALAADPALELVPFEAVGQPVTEDIRAFREAWLGSKAD